MTRHEGLHQLAEGATVKELTLEEGRALLDKQSRRYLNMGVDEFLAAWDAGAFDDNPDRPEVMRVAMLTPFARSDDSAS